MRTRFNAEKPPSEPRLKFPVTITTNDGGRLRTLETSALLAARSFPDLRDRIAGLRFGQSFSVDRPKPSGGYVDVTITRPTPEALGQSGATRSALRWALEDERFQRKFAHRPTFPSDKKRPSKSRVPVRRVLRDATKRLRDAGLSRAQAAEHLYAAGEETPTQAFLRERAEVSPLSNEPVDHGLVECPRCPYEFHSWDDCPNNPDND